MLKLVSVLSLHQQTQLRDHLHQHRALLSTDVSRYAVGRQRFWLEHQAILGSTGKDYRPGAKLPWLWEICQKIYSRALEQVDLPPALPDLGLVAYGQIGIKTHRDDTYAAVPAVSINLSTQPTQWGYTPAYSGFEPRQPSAEREVVHTLSPGAVIVFNSKNLHRVVAADPQRWSINLWSIAPRCRPYFDAYLAQTGAIGS